MQSIRLSAAALFATALLAGTASAGSPNSGKTLKVEMTGGAERPGPGDPDGSGNARFNVHHSKNRICYELRVADIAPATVAHIHRAGPDAPGPIVVHLVAPTNGSSAACADVTAELARDIHQNPENFYVNVHNAEFPPGAVRGQLDK